MSDAERDTRSGRFLPGNSGNGGRKPGARNKLGEAFLEDLLETWNDQGIEALRRCATEEPAQFCKIVASLMPRDLNINANIGVNPGTFVENFRTALAMLGNEPPPRPRLKVIDNERQ